LDESSATLPHELPNSKNVTQMRHPPTRRRHFSTSINNMVSKNIHIGYRVRVARLLVK
jgi:hypothetical protein